MAKQAAKEWWEENGKSVVNDTASAAKEYWNANKESILDGAKLTAKQLSDEVLKKAQAYADAKLEKEREKVIAKLVAGGIKREDIDANKDGTITDEELEVFLKENPSALLKVGIGLLGWWSLVQLKRRVAKPASPPNQPPAPSPA